MKNFIKVLFVVLTFFCFYSLQVLDVHAAENDKGQTDGSGSGDEDESYAYIGTFTGTNTDGSYCTYKMYSDERIGIVLRDGFYRLYFPTRVYYKETWYGYANVNDEHMSYKKSNELKQFNAITGYTFCNLLWSPKYDEYTSTFPIFDNYDAYKKYIETGDDSERINEKQPDITDDQELYDETLGHIEGLNIEGLSYDECHGTVDFFANCFSLSWTIPNYDKSKYMEFYEFKFDMLYSYITSTMTKRAYGSKFLDFTSSGKKLFISVTEGTHIFCAHDFYELLNLDVKATSFYIQDVRKIYVRLARVNRASGDISYGDWAVYDVDFRGGTFTNERIIGGSSIYPGNVEIGDGGIIEDEPTQTIPAPDSSDNGFSFAGIDLTDVVNIGKYFIGLVESLINMIGSFPALFNRIFLFLPVEIRTMIYMFFVILVISGLLKIFV